MPCFKSQRSKLPSLPQAFGRWLKLLRLLCLLCLFWLAVGLGLGFGFAQTQTPPPEGVTLSTERIDDTLRLSAQLQFELSPAVQDALYKGIAVIFVVETDLLRERWYWTDKKVASTQRWIRLAYQPLTRQWRVNRAADDTSAPGLRLSLNQNFDTLLDAMAAVQRLYRWRIADVADLEPGTPHLVAFRFRLDVTQLPRPLQIGTLGQSDWTVSISSTQPIKPETLAPSPGQSADLQ